MNKGFLLCLTTFFLVNVFANISYAEPAVKGMHQHNERQYKNVTYSCKDKQSNKVEDIIWLNDYSFFKRLDLTTLQREQIRDLMRGKAKIQLKTSVKHMENMNSLVYSDTFDDKAVRNEIKENIDKRVDLFVQLAYINHQIYSLLTVEQQKQLHQWQKERMFCLEQTMSDH